MSLEMPQRAHSADVLPLRRRSRSRRRGPLKSAQNRAQVIDLAVEREKRIPNEVLDAMAQAEAFWEHLDAAGVHVHFDLTRDGVSAVLRDEHQGLERPLSLVDAVDPPHLLPPDAA
jgi:hypothetical protein